MSTPLRAIDGGKAAESTLEAIQRACRARAQQIRTSPQLAAEIEARSKKTHATVRAAEEAMRSPAPASSARKNNVTSIGDHRK